MKVAAVVSKVPSDFVSVMRPKLPTCDQLIPYLRLIDASRNYSNHGRLSLELGQRLADFLSLPPDGVVCAASGTTALIGAILATAGRARPKLPLALLPAYTFVGTASAVEQCGYRPYLADIDEQTWMLDPQRLMLFPELDRVGLVVPVAPFGRPVPQEAWWIFSQRTGIPVVIDGAASLEGLARTPDLFIGNVPVALSFHATKSFATGEGGAVVSTNTDLVELTTQALNFGFYGDRNSRTCSTNGKMSEYHAAVGLAELDGWNAKLASLRAVADHYRHLLNRVGLINRFFAAPDISSCYALFRCTGTNEAKYVQECLRRRRVDFRLWYGKGLHHQSYFSDLSHECLKVTDTLAPCLLGVPIATEFSKANIWRVVAALEMMRAVQFDQPPQSVQAEC